MARPKRRNGGASPPPATRFFASSPLGRPYSASTSTGRSRRFFTTVLFCVVEQAVTQRRFSEFQRKGLPNGPSIYPPEVQKNFCGTMPYEDRSGSPSEFWHSRFWPTGSQK